MIRREGPIMPQLEMNIFKKALKALQKDYSNAEIFWNVIVYLAYIIILFIDVEAAFIISGFGSLLMLGLCLDKKEHFELWYPLTWLFYILLIIMGIISLCMWLYERTLRKFNNWLNKEKHDS